MTATMRKNYILYSILIGFIGLVSLGFFSCNNKTDCSSEKTINAVKKALGKDIEFIYASSSIRCYFPENNTLQPNTVAESDQLIAQFDNIFARIKPFDEPTKKVKAVYLSLVESLKTVKKFNGQIEDLRTQPDSPKRNKQLENVIANKDAHVLDFNATFPKELQGAMQNYYVALRTKLNDAVKGSCSNSLNILYDDEIQKIMRGVYPLWEAETKKPQNIANTPKMQSCIKQANASYETNVKQLFAKNFKE